jgi:predicted 2-oxoglutarate/Fe(II)-dependent dioxygenase YbiX
VRYAKMDEATHVCVHARLRQIQPQLEAHFGLPLSGFEEPNFLRYGPGAFYKPHQDANPDSPPQTIRRQVSVVIFLNGPGNDSSSDCFAGGALTFYGLMQGAQWESCGLPLEPEPGLLVAFRSDTMHEVQPVTSGERYTVVTWFTS